MKGNLSKKKGLESSISNDHLDYIAGKLGDTLLNPKILAFLNIANQYQKTELYQTLIELLESLEEQKADSDDLPTKLSQLENDPEFVTQKIVDAVISRVKALEDKDWSDLELDQYQKKLTFDDIPTADSTNPVTSGGIKEYIIEATAEDIDNWIGNSDTTSVVGEATAGNAIVGI